MPGHRLLLCLATIGWTERELARRAGRHQTTIVRWVRRGLDDSRIANRLEALAAAHEANRLS